MSEMCLINDLTDEVAFALIEVEQNFVINFSVFHF